MAFRIKGLFDNYLRHNEINDYLDYLADKFPDTVKVSTYGNSYEGRLLKLIRISTPKTTTRHRSKSFRRRSSTVSSGRKTPGRRKSLSLKRNSKSTEKKTGRLSKSCTSKRNVTKPDSAIGKAASSSKCNETSRLLKPTTESDSLTKPNKRKPIVLIDGGIHAREWITVSTALYCIYQLTEEMNANQTLLNNLDFVIIPVVNADGYEYSHTHSRYWRKTRKPIVGSSHIGTDCNRNFDFHWSLASSHASKLTFRGSCPFSEPETVALRTIMHSLKADCKFYLSLHSHAQAFLYPWGFTKELPKNWMELHRIATAGRDAIKKKTGRSYRTGSVAVLFKHTAAGGSPDYALGVVKIPYAMAMEITGAGYGFDPPCSLIQGLVSESWVGIRAMCERIGKLCCKSYSS